MTQSPYLCKSKNQPKISHHYFLLVFSLTIELTASL